MHTAEFFYPTWKVSRQLPHLLYNAHVYGTVLYFTVLYPEIRPRISKALRM